MTAPFPRLLAQVDALKDLTSEDSRSAFDAIFNGAVSEDLLASFLIALNTKGETPDELLGAARSMRDHALKINAPPGAMDIVGTGGDSHGTLNISTAVALVVAGCGVPVAKHGNRASTSRSGSSDVLIALGINVDADFKVLEECLEVAKCCFLHAPRHHPAMRHVAEIRRRLNRRTIFNLLGPLTNPANIRKHLIGVYSLEWLGPMAEVLKGLGSESAWLAHGHDGMDEMTTTEATDIVELRHGMIRHFTLEPEQVGLARAPLAALKGGDATQNAAAIHALLRGEKNAYRDIVVFNAAGALVVAGKVKDLSQGVRAAADCLDTGAARAVLTKLIELTS
ncbi:MAG: anthranilate phosphoribosyltransferase [Pseudomonadota bacterium]|nr:anthranilate phosphoribosyltransferase [Pseudomonadota bacterium]